MQKLSLIVVGVVVGVFLNLIPLIIPHERTDADGHVGVPLQWYAARAQADIQSEHPAYPPLARPPSVTAAIVGGDDARRGEFPWQAHIAVTGLGTCGGSLIHPNWVLTAAHCLMLNADSTVTPGAVRVVLGEHVLNADEGSEQEIVGQSITIHPDYNHSDQSNNDADIALIELSTPAIINAFVQPVTLLTPDQEMLVSAGQDATVIGWGQGAYGSFERASDTLQKVVVPIVPLKTCQNAYPSKVVSSNMVCAGYVEGGRDACQGDSGSPLMVQSATGWTQVGLVSWGYRCAYPEKYGVYTHVGMMRNWIGENSELAVLPTPTATTPASPMSTSTVTPTPLLITPFPGTPGSTATPTNTATPTPTPIATMPTGTAIMSTPTSTLLPIASPTATPLVVPTVSTPVPVTMPLRNGDFESGSDGVWNEQSTNFSGNSNVLILNLAELQNDIYPNSGTYAAWLGGTDLENASLTQSLIMPANQPIVLSYFYQIRAHDECGADIVLIRVNNQVIHSVELCSETTTAGWVQETLDLSAYAGQFVALGFNITTDGFSPAVGGQNAPSNFFLDDVQLIDGNGDPEGNDGFDPDTPPLTIEPTVTSPFVVPPIEGTPAPNAIENHSFEEPNGTTWSEDSAIYGGDGSLITSILDLPRGIVPYSGTYLAWLGGINEEVSILNQTVTLPADAETLYFYHQIDSTDACGFDSVTISLNRKKVDEISLCLAQQTDGWQLRSIDIRSYAGQSVELMFRLATDELLISSWYVDNIVVSTTSLPQLGADPANLSFIKADNRLVSSQSVEILTGETTVWSVTAAINVDSNDGGAQSDWLRVVAHSGGANRNRSSINDATIGIGPGSIRASVDPSGLSIGVYHGTISLRSGAVLTTIPVTLDIRVDDSGNTTPEVIPLSVQPGVSSLNLAWGIPNSSTIFGYRVYRRYGQQSTLVGTSTEPRLKDTSDTLLAGERYCYQIEGVNLANNGQVLASELLLSETACAIFSVQPLWIPDLMAAPGAGVDVPVNVSNADGLTLKEGKLLINFDSRVVNIRGVSNSMLAPDAQWSFNLVPLNENKSQAQVRLVTDSSSAGGNAPSQSIWGSGPLFYLNVDVIGNATDRTALAVQDTGMGTGNSTIVLDNGSPNGLPINLAPTDGLLTVQEFGIHQPGDVDGDGRIDITDVTTALDIATGKVEPSIEQRNASELNGTDRIEAADATRILTYAIFGSWPLAGVNNGLNNNGDLETSTALLPHQEITVGLKEATGVGGEPISLLIGSPALNNFAGGDFVLIYDPTIITNIESISLGPGLDGFQHSFDATTPGRLAISIAGPTEANNVELIALIKADTAWVPELTVSPIKLADATLNHLNGRDLISTYANKSLKLQSSVITLEANITNVFLPIIR